VIVIRNPNQPGAVGFGLDFVLNALRQQIIAKQARLLFVGKISNASHRAGSGKRELLTAAAKLRYRCIAEIDKPDLREGEPQL
jgi:hypothetical protein